MFLLRCVFFLSIVWATITLGGGGGGGGALRGPDDIVAAVARQGSTVTDAALARATDWCASRPALCARDAARLTALAKTATAGDDGLAPADAEASHVPMPVPDPRRRSARALLTDAH